MQDGSLSLDQNAKKALFMTPERSQVQVNGAQPAVFNMLVSLGQDQKVVTLFRRLEADYRRKT